VYVPSDVNVAVHAEAGAGEVELFGADDGGVTVEMDDELLVAGARTLRLDLRTGVGRLVVDRDLSTIETPPDQGLR
jgi:predicted membrane protein